MTGQPLARAGGRKPSTKHYIFIPPPTPAGLKAEEGRAAICCAQPKTGLAAAMEEYSYFKARGMLAFWRDKWRGVLRHH